MKRPTTQIAFPLGLCLAASIASVLGVTLRERREFGTITQEAQRQPTELFASKDKPEPTVAAAYMRLVDELRRYYVQPIKDEQKLAIGGVKGMVNSLQDGNARFLTPEQRVAYENGLSGKFEGIGVELTLQYLPLKGAKPVKGQDEEILIPEIRVSALLPGGAAEKAGIFEGDRIDAIGSKWVFSQQKSQEFADEFKKLRSASKFDPATEAKLRELLSRARNGLSIVRAMDKIASFKKGSIDITVSRLAGKKQFTLTPTDLEVPPTIDQGNGTYEFRFFKGADRALKELMAGKSELTLDLRSSTRGDWATMLKCLELVGGADTYGTLASENINGNRPLKIASGKPTNTKLKLVVDFTTRGAAEVFALALSSRGKATLQGKVTGGDRQYVKLFALPDGGGYLLPVAEYRSAVKAGGAK